MLHGVHPNCKTNLRTYDRRIPSEDHAKHVSLVGPLPDTLIVVAEVQRGILIVRHGVTMMWSSVCVLSATVT